MALRTYSRSRDVITDDTPSVTKSRPKPAPKIEHDNKVAMQSHRHPDKLAAWLERVESRFFGVPTDMHPYDAVLYALRISAGEVAYCDAQITRLTEDELFERPVRTMYAQMPSGHFEMVEEKRDAQVLSRWVQLRQDAVDHMARYAKMAVDIGIENEQIQMAQREADMIAKFFEIVMSELQLTQEQRDKVGPAMRRHAAMFTRTW